MAIVRFRVRDVVRMKFSDWKCWTKSERAGTNTIASHEVNNRSCFKK